MNVNLLAVSVGNTHVRLGAFLDGKITESRVAPAGDLDAFADAAKALWTLVQDAEGAACVVASVNPGPTRAITDWITGNLDTDALRVEKDMRIPVGRQLDHETIVGEDRLLNAAAAYSVLKQALVVVDAGTAITIDFVDGVGTFHGGAIGPGARMMLHSMQQGTAQLPEVELVRPKEAIGHNTAEAMRSAVFHGLRGMTRELLEAYAEAAGAFPLLVATGGDAPLLFEGWELIDRIVPDLTLIGIAVTLQAALNAEADADGDDDEEED
ncbi:MAG: type III pantothenate kinase [Planctomycetota bacterium]|nr:type III pantothenate kinase [Planctomycetota bacterium]